MDRSARVNSEAQPEEVNHTTRSNLASKSSTGLSRTQEAELTLASRVQKNAYRPLTCPPVGRKERLKMVLNARAQERDKWSKKRGRDSSAHEPRATTAGVKRAQSVYHQSNRQQHQISLHLNNNDHVSRANSGRSSDRPSVRLRHHSFAVRAHAPAAGSTTSFQSSVRLTDSSRLGTPLHSNSTTAMNDSYNMHARTKSAITKRNNLREETSKLKPQSQLHSKSSLFP